MNYVVAAIFDSKVKAYLPPFFVVNQAVAQRQFADCANHDQHSIHRNPLDYGLFIIGNFNDETAEIRMFPQHINLGLAASYIKEQVHVSEIPEQAISDAARVFKSSAGGNSKKHVRPEPRPQDDV